MRRIASRTLLMMAAAAALGLVGFSGCADNRSTLFVVGVLAKSEDCMVVFDPGQPRIGRGLMDTLVAASYSPSVLVGNQMVPQGNNQQIRTETSRIDLLEAEVRLSQVGGAEVAHFTTIISGSINPAPSEAPGFGGANVLMIPPGLALPEGEFIAEVIIHGRTLGGKDVETGEFRFPIQVCRGCSVFGEVDAEGRCIAETGTPAGSCRPGQDGPTHCSVCLAVTRGNPACNPR